MTSLCERCGKPLATYGDWARCQPGCECEKCLSICWQQGTCEEYDWMAECLRLREEIGMLKADNEVQAILTGKRWMRMECNEEVSGWKKVNKTADVPPPDPS